MFVFIDVFEPCQQGLEESNNLVNLVVAEHLICDNRHGHALSNGRQYFAFVFVFCFYLGNV
jgi:hypothetical protein